MADWYRTDAALFRHPKIAALDHELKQERTGWYVHGLWSWMTTYARDGVFDRGLTEHIERECGWRNEPGLLLAAMVTVRLLDERQNGQLEVHDWDDFQGAVVEKAEKDAARKRAQRSRDKARDRPRDVRVTGGRDVTRDGAGTRRDGRDVTDGRDETKVAGERPPSKTERDPKPEKVPDPRHHPLKLELIKVFAEENGGTAYPFTGRDAKAVAELLALGLEPTIAAAWRAALRSTGYPLVRTLPELVTHFPHFVARRGPVDLDAERIATHEREQGDLL